MMEDPNQSPPPESEGSTIDYRQLGLFSIIVAELTLVPGGLGGITYYLTRGQAPLGVSWKVWTGMAVGLGFGIAFYRIFLLSRQMKKNG
jgi:hypothetical protein